MALTKVGSGGIENVTNSANATFLTIDASEQITVASEGGSVTTSVQQGLCKSWCQWNNAGTPTASDSLNLSSITDTATGRPDLNFTNNMNNASYAASGFGRSGYSMMWDHASTSQIGVIIWYGGTYYDANLASYMIQGDLA